MGSDRGSGSGERLSRLRVARMCNGSWKGRWQASAFSLLRTRSDMLTWRGFARDLQRGLATIR